VRPVGRSRRVAAGLTGAVLLLGLAWLVVGLGGSRPPADPLADARLIEADTLPDADAVGLCAVLRATGAPEGRIIGITASPGTERPRYRIQSLANPAVEHSVEATAIRIVSCEALPAAGDRLPMAPARRTP
jgi:hypothetical protein